MLLLFYGQGGSPHESEAFHIRFLELCLASHEVLEKNGGWLKAEVSVGHRVRNPVWWCHPRVASPCLKTGSSLSLPGHLRHFLGWKQCSGSCLPCQIYHTLPGHGHPSHRLMNNCSPTASQNLYQERPWKWKGVKYLCFSRLPGRRRAEVCTCCPGEQGFVGAHFLWVIPHEESRVPACADTRALSESSVGFSVLI